MRNQISRFLGLSILTCLSYNSVYGQAIESAVQNTEQASVKDIGEMDIADLMNVQVTVATKTTMPVNEAPGILSVVTSEEIMNSGARDLTDILTTFVAGFQVTAESGFTTGPAIRGINSMEGKILLLIDGMEVNEDVAGNTFFRNHYPADLIHRVEVIRGPGSALYGNYASVGVISVTTKAAVKNSANLHALNSQMSETHDYRGLVAGYNKEHTSNFSSSAYIAAGDGSASDRNYDFFFLPLTIPASNDMAERYVTKPKMFLGNIAYSNFELGVLLDRYETNYPAQAGPEVFTNVSFYSDIFDLKYNYIINDKLKIVPRYSYKDHGPFVREDTGLDPGQWGTDVLESHIHSKRSFYGLSAFWNPNKATNVVSGIEHYKTTIYIADGWDNKTNSGINPPESFTKFPRNSFINENSAVYMQGTFNTSLLNYTIGARYENTMRYGDTFVPRLGLTKTFDKLTTKLMLAESFRAPIGLQEEFSTVSMKAEKALNTEFEIAYNLQNLGIISLDVYDIQYNDVIIYTASGFANSGGQRTQGIEAEYKYQKGRTSLNFNYAYYHGLTKPDVNQVVADSNANLGLAQQRANITGGVRLSERWSVHPTLQYSGVKYANITTDATDPTTDRVVKLDPETYFTLNLRARDVFRKGLEIDFGGHNLFNEKGYTPTSYPTTVNPVPVDSRSWMVRLNYSL